MENHSKNKTIQSAVIFIVVFAVAFFATWYFMKK